MPSIITITGLKFEKGTGAALGIVKLGIPMGSILFPFLLSMLSRYVGFTVSFLLFPAAGIACFLMFMLSGIMIRRAR